jgi:hypothetical protein
MVYTASLFAERSLDGTAFDWLELRPVLAAAQGVPERVLEDADLPGATLGLPLAVWGAPGEGAFGPLELFKKLPALAAWLGRARGAELYLPAHRHQTLGRGMDGLGQAELLSSFSVVPKWNRPRPLRAEPGPGRNEPCGCGSGKKSKRCCAA